ncbi:MAG: hypothetical protein ACTSO2_20390, partial [Promethearchaeota archaeon]
SEGHYYHLINSLIKIFGAFLRFNKIIKELDVNIMCQSHLDAAWQWTRYDTQWRAYYTFERALDFIEHYPHFKFGSSTPQYYWWLEREDPKMFEKIKEYVKLGRWELLGGMWVEPDLNIPCGESLVRQRLYGQRYYYSRFNQIARISWLPDVFGFCWSLPQILVKSGADYFYTTKLLWNDTNIWPFSFYIWRGNDGTEILSHVFNYQIMNYLFLKDWKKLARFAKDPKKVLSSANTNAEIEANRSDEYIKEFGLVYGYGDGGGGPLEDEIILYTNWARANRWKFSTFLSYFKKLDKYREKIPIWNDEGYLEFHRGVYTVHSEIKGINRLCETTLISNEKLCTLVDLILKTKRFAKPKYFEGAWRITLFNQFHDILPGSSIEEVYIDAIKDGKRAIKYIEKKGLRALKAYNDRFNEIDQSVAEKILGLCGGLDNIQTILKVLTFNSLSFVYDGYLEVDIDSSLISEKEILVFSSSGEPLKYQIASEDVYFDVYWKQRKPSEGKNRIIIDLSEFQLNPLNFDEIYIITRFKNKKYF